MMDTALFASDNSEQNQWNPCYHGAYILKVSSLLLELTDCSILHEPCECTWFSFHVFAILGLLPLLSRAYLGRCTKWCTKSSKQIYTNRLVSIWVKGAKGNKSSQNIVKTKTKSKPS